MALWILILNGVSSYILTLFWYQVFYDICGKHLQRTNFQQRTIPTAMGISISLTIVTMICIQPDWLLTKKDLMIAVAVLTATCIGLLDDITNDKQWKGLKGHLKFFLVKKRFTSGGLKAIVLTVASVWVATQFSHTLVGIVVGTALVALMTNTINLFDLRPGRALKATTGILVCLIVYSMIYQESTSEIQAWKWYIILFMAVLAFMPKDLQGIVMLGDTGANVLGILLGILCLQHLSLSWQIGMVVSLISIHVLAEMYSISKLIDRIAVLRWLDRLGVPVAAYWQSPESNDMMGKLAESNEHENGATDNAELQS